MIERISRYFKNVSYVLFFVLYLIWLLNKLSIGIGAVNIVLLFKVAVIITLLGTYSTVVEAREKTNINRVDGVNRKNDPPLSRWIKSISDTTTKHIIASKYANSITNPRKRYISICLLGLVAVCSYILIDIFSSTQSSNYITLLITFLWVICSQITKLGGKATILGGIVLLCLCPFFVIFKLENSADKSAVWAYMFFVGGLIQQMVSRDDVPLNKTIANLKQLLSDHT